MPETYRETMVLRFVEGLTGPEIAERTGLAPVSVRVNLHRGVRLLRKKLGDPRRPMSEYWWDRSGRDPIWRGSRAC